MKWKAHTRTAEKILEHFDALHFKKYEHDLVNGIISPDNEDEKNHYTGREQTTLTHIRHAREKRLQYDTAGCFFHLGVAFHYIQDLWVGLGPDNEAHETYLELINRSNIIDIHESLEKYYPVKRRRVYEQFKELEKRLSKPLESETELKDIVYLRRPYENAAFLDLNISFRVCYRIAEITLKTMYNVNLQESLQLLKTSFESQIMEKENEETQKLEILTEETEQHAQDNSTMGKIRHWQIEKTLNKTIKNYEERNHLKPILSKFEEEIDSLCKPHEKWFNIDRPSIDIEAILSPKIETREEFKESADTIESVIVELQTE